MGILQQQPAEISLLEESKKLILQEKTDVKWLIKILGFWFLMSALVLYVLSLNHTSLWIIVLILGTALTIEAMTLISWVVMQMYVFDTDDNTVTFTTQGLLAKPNVQRYFISDIQTINLVPKTKSNAWSYYISLQLKTGECLDIDLTSSASVDQIIVQQIQNFLHLKAQYLREEEAMKD